jgi:hypothetical protein
MKQRWRATWLEGNERQEFIFDSIANRMIARIDFRLKFPYAMQGKAPEQYELEEVDHAGNSTTQLIYAHKPGVSEATRHGRIHQGG